MSAAGKISRLAVGDPKTSPIIDTYRVRADVTQNEHIDGLPLGTRGGVLIQHNFPLDGDYIIKVKLLKSTVDLLFGGTAPDETLEIAVNGAARRRLTINPTPKEAPSPQPPPVAQSPEPSTPPPPPAQPKRSRPIASKPASP